MRSSVLLFSAILSSLVVAGFSLTCNECEGEDEKSCKGSTATCPPESEFCLAVLKSTIQGGQEVKQYKRSCGEKSMCSQRESFTYSDGVMKISSSCCSTSNCVPPMPTLPQTKTEKNGVSCMECQGSGDTPCTSSTRRECTGDEKQCVSLTITTKSPDTSMSGCGTPGLCMKKMDFKEMKFSCPSGSGSLQYSLSLLIFAPMFLVKVIG